MADAVLTYDALGEEKVVAAGKKVEGSMNGVKRGATKGAMGLLEASRAIEDFSMAGMRGALNNIPGVMMGIGASMTMVAGTTIGLVAVMQGVKVLEDILNKAHEKRLKTYERGVKSIDIFKMEENALASAKIEALKYLEVIQEIAFNSQESKQVSSLHKGNQQLERELKYLQQIRILETMMADESEKRKAARDRQISDAKASADAEYQSVQITKEQINQLKKLKKEQEDIIASIPMDEINEINKKVMDRNTLETQNRIDVMKSVKKGKPLTEANLAYIDSKAKDASDAYFKIIAGDREDEIRQQIEQTTLAKEKLKMLDDEINKSEKRLQLEYASSDAAQQRAKIETDIINERFKLDEMLAKRDDEKNRKKGFASLDFMDGSNFLSEQGKSGLRSDEAQSALESMGYQRSMLIELKQINRNTRSTTSRYERN